MSLDELETTQPVEQPVEEPASAGREEITPDSDELDRLWAVHHAEWRDPAQITSQWEEANRFDPQLLKYKVRGKWWETLAELGITLLVTREYEHLVMALHAVDGQPSISYLRLPHPSGLAVDRVRQVVYLASTRNPNQIYTLRPVTDHLPRLDVDNNDVSVKAASRGVRLGGGHRLGWPLRPLVPVQSIFLPGCFYLHDLAMIGDVLHANSVGQNAVVSFTAGRSESGEANRLVWWPRCIETETGPVFGQNHIQLNSIAAGTDLASSYFSASTDKISARRPGHKNFPVDGRGVIFSGTTREPIVHGLTRPHSARLTEDGQLWVDNSGYGELGMVELPRLAASDGTVSHNGKFQPVVRLPGWTRGLSFHGKIAFVGTSRVIPRFRQYAPGVDVDASLCGLHAVNIESGEVLGSLLWPYGNQIFAIEWIPTTYSTGFPFSASKRATAQEKRLFYTFKTVP